MTSAAGSLRTRFLEESARLLAISSPSSAAYLGSEARELRNESRQDLPPLSKRQACATCGSFYLPGYNCSVTIDKLSGNPTTVPTKTVRVRCRICDRSSIGTFPRPRKRTVKIDREGNDKRTSGLPRDSSIHSDPKESNSAVISTSSSRKKRAKAMRQGNLQALVEKTRQPKEKPGNEGEGLSLMDFMHE